MSTRWSGSDAPRGDDYDARWARLAAAGESVHGEADLVDALLQEHGGTRVLDAGCGTGRVAIELAARGYVAVGVDLDPVMLATARAKAPTLTWIEADLARLDAVAALPGASTGAGFDLVVLAGNVMIFLDPGSEAAVLAALRAQLVEGGLLVAGFQLRPDRLSLAEYDRLTAAAGFVPLARWATWERGPFAEGDYVVSVHRAGPGPDRAE
jgi:SAM-dependent methyltransferase